MKKNFQKILAAAILCFFASEASAQSNLSWPQKKHLVATKLGAALKDSLNLDAGKVTKIQEINSKYQVMFGKVANDTSLSADEKKMKYAEVYKSKREELKKEITPDQIGRMEVMENRLKKEIGL